MLVHVSKALESQSKIRRTRENCSINHDVADQYNINEGVQLRVRNRKTGQTGAYTVHDIRPDDPPLRLSHKSRKKLGSTAPFPADIEGTTIPNE